MLQMIYRTRFRGHLPPWKDVEIYEPISICTLSKAPFHVLFQTIMRDMVTQLDWFQRPEKGFVRETMLSTVYADGDVVLHGRHWINWPYFVCVLMALLPSFCFRCRAVTIL